MSEEEVILISRKIFLHDLLVSIDVLPDDLLGPAAETLEEFKGWAKRTTEYALGGNEITAQFIYHLEAGHKHLDIHCITLTPSFRVLCGLTSDEFHHLLHQLRPDLEKCFPKSKFQLEPRETSENSSIRMKVFMFLYRLKIGSSFRNLEALFGWSRTQLCEQFTLISKLLHAKLYFLHDGILEYLTPEWQLNETRCWKLKHLIDKSFQLFLRRIQVMNAESVGKGETEVYIKLLCAI
jgi:hypothetical protein